MSATSQDMKLAADLLQRSPEEATRWICLSFLDDANSALARLDDLQDAEALHDFRVAVRRLRSASRAWQPVLKGAIRKKDRKALRALHRATSLARDTEVLIVWMEPVRPDLHWSHRVGYDWLLARLQRRRAQGYESARTTVRLEFESLERRLRAQLGVMTVQVNLFEPKRQATFGESLAGSVREYVQEVYELLSRASTADVEVAHDARIAVKRLRYLIEPLRRVVPAVRPCIKQCKELQDILGQLQDANVMLDEVSQAVGKAAAQRARRLHHLMRNGDDAALRREQRRSEQSGLLELARLSRLRIDALFRELEQWRSDRLEGFVMEFGTLGQELERRGGIEIERKYLLDGLPDRVQAVTPIEIDQGYLPGDALQERLRKKVQNGGSASFIRTVKHGNGMARLELEEPTSRGLFDALWPFTEGRRVCKLRYKVPDGELVWEIDHFKDRDLVVAEVELPSEDHEPTIPDWLRPHLVREVTDEPEYLNINLAR